MWRQTFNALKSCLWLCYLNIDVHLFSKQVHEEQITPKINKNEKTDLVPSSYQLFQQLQKETIAVARESQPVQQLPYGGGGGKPFNSADRLAGALWEGGV